MQLISRIRPVLIALLWHPGPTAGVSVFPPHTTPKPPLTPLPQPRQPNERQEGALVQSLAMTAKPSIVTRFAPSPTGNLHIGGARTALFCWAWARSPQGDGDGTFILRIEDTDQARSSDESTLAILEDMAWLGIDWDEGPEVELVDEIEGVDSITLGGDPRSVGPFEQSARLDIYDQAIQKLIDEGKAYHAFETTADLEAKRAAATKAKKTFRYDRAALDIPESLRLQRVADGESHVVRLRVPDDEAFVVHDAVLGDVTFAPGELEDFIIKKRDGFPTYHLAVVVDDALMGVTHILRGQEHLANTPKHVALQRALGYETPTYAHMPLLFNDKGAKMSKRERDQVARDHILRLINDGNADHISPIEDIIDSETYAAWLKDKKIQLEHGQLEVLSEFFDIALPEVSVDDFRRAGYLPEVILNFISLLGWTPPKADDGSEIEKFDMDFLAEHFTLDRIGKSNARFDRAKLLAFNLAAIQEMPTEEFIERFAEWCEQEAPVIIEGLTEEAFIMLATAVQPQSKTFLDAATRCAFAAVDSDEIEIDPKALKKVITRNDGEGLSVLKAFREDLAAHTDESIEGFANLIKSHCEKTGLGMGKVAQPLRVAMTGTPVSPPIAETIAAIGKDQLMARIDRCIQQAEAAIATPAS